MYLDRSRARVYGARCRLNFNPAACIRAGHGADVSATVGSKPKNRAARTHHGRWYQGVLPGAGIHPHARDGAGNGTVVSGCDGNAGGIPYWCGHVANGDRTTKVRGHRKREVVAGAAIDNLGLAQAWRHEQRGYRNDKGRNAGVKRTSNIHDLLRLIDPISAPGTHVVRWPAGTTSPPASTNSKGMMESVREESYERFAVAGST